MIAIRGFIEQIIYISVVTIIIELILPKGNTKKYVYAILSLFVLLNIISPVINVIREIDIEKIYEDMIIDVSKTTDLKQNKAVEAFSTYKNNKVLDTIEKEVINKVKDRFGDMNVIVSSVDVSFTDEYTIEKLEVITQNLEHLGKGKEEKIYDLMKMLEKEFEIAEGIVSITEEGI